MNIMGERSMSENSFQPCFAPSRYFGSLHWKDFQQILDVSTRGAKQYKQQYKHFEVCDEVDGGSLDL